MCLNSLVMGVEFQAIHFVGKGSYAENAIG